MSDDSDLELRFDFCLKAVSAERGARLPEPTKEYRFVAARKWRFDRAWVDQKIAVELEGGIWTNGGHTRGAGFDRNCEKYNYAALMGWRVFRFTISMLRDDPERYIGVLLQALRNGK